MREKSGIFGIGGAGLEAARLVHTGLWTLRHRRQESSGISVSNGETIRTHKGSGLVAHVYDEAALSRLAGPMAIGHNRYFTSGGAPPRTASRSQAAGVSWCWPTTETCPPFPAWSRFSEPTASLPLEPTIPS